MQARQSGRMTIYNRPAITNCVIAGNIHNGVSGGLPTITNCTIASNTGFGISVSNSTVMNSIIYYNGSDITQIESPSNTAVTYSDVQGGWPGEGNIDAVPLFVWLPHWTGGFGGGEEPDEFSNGFWVSGNYYLQSQAGRWDPIFVQDWVQDSSTSPCIDAGNPDFDCSAEPAPNGGRINMGAYGGTIQASKSISR
jgi:hypothetical protein